MKTHKYTVAVGKDGERRIWVGAYSLSSNRFGWKPEKECLAHSSIPQFGETKDKPEWAEKLITVTIEFHELEIKEEKPDAFFYKLSGDNIEGEAFFLDFKVVSEILEGMGYKKDRDLNLERKQEAIFSREVGCIEFGETKRIQKAFIKPLKAYPYEKLMW